MATFESIRLATVRRIAASGEAERLRVEAGLSRGDVARDIGITETSLRRWERGLRRPSGRAALRYLELLAALKGVR